MLPISHDNVYINNTRRGFKLVTTGSNIKNYKTIPVKLEKPALKKNYSLLLIYEAFGIT